MSGDNRYHAVIGGKGCFAVCPSDTAVALAALYAHVVLKGKLGEKTVPIRDLYTPMGNALAQDELLIRIVIPPLPQGAKRSFTSSY